MKPTDQRGPRLFRSREDVEGLPRSAFAEGLDDPATYLRLIHSATSSQGTVATNGGVAVASLGTVGVGASATVTVLARANAAGSLTNTAMVSANESDLHLADNVASLVTTIIRPVADLSISKTATNSALIGDSLSYTIAVANNGPENAVNVVVTDPLPVGLGSASASLGAGSWTNQGGVITASLGTLAPGGNASFTITATIPKNTTTSRSTRASRKPLIRCVSFSKTGGKWRCRSSCIHSAR